MDSNQRKQLWIFKKTSQNQKILSGNAVSIPIGGRSIAFTHAIHESKNKSSKSTRTFRFQPEKKMRNRKKRSVISHQEVQSSRENP